MAEELDFMHTEEIKKDNREGLKQLLDSTYPLLHKFRDLCPGTYKHSQVVAGMVEGISMALGLDVLKTKVAAQYHDIGKMFSPKYFTENQLEEEDPHKELDPHISYMIITRHVSDSAAILVNDHNFPRDVIEIISQHHGTSITKYFFNKSDTAVEDMFRYKTPKPKCVESAILMVCDYIEAMSRSLIQHNKLDPDSIIETVITGLMDDGQLDDVRLGDLKKIKSALVKELEGTFSKRIDYDKAKEEKIK